MAELRRIKGDSPCAKAGPPPRRTFAPRSRLRAPRAPCPGCCGRRPASSRDCSDRQGRIPEARGLLAAVYGDFTEGFDLADLQAARLLLDELASAQRLRAHARLTASIVQSTSTLRQLTKISATSLGPALACEVKAPCEGNIASKPSARRAICPMRPAVGTATATSHSHHWGKLVMTWFPAADGTQIYYKDWGSGPARGLQPRLAAQRRCLGGPDGLPGLAAATAASPTTAAATAARASPGTATTWTPTPTTSRRSSTRST